MERYRIHKDGSLYFVTYSIVDWLPVFVSEGACRIVTESLSYCHHAKHLGVNAYVVMPTHMHAIVFDRAFNSDRLAATMTAFRKHTGRTIADYVRQHGPRCHLEAMQAAAGDDRARRVWQPTRHPMVIESEPFWQQKFDYLHENPSRKGLVIRAQDWRFSSATYWLSDGRVPSEVPLTPIMW